MFLKFGSVLLLVLAAFLVYVGIKDGSYEISREIAVRAPADKIFPYLNNSRLMEKWTPWPEVDPEAKMTYSGPIEGVGSKTSWEGGKQLGTGSATITESIPSQKVGIQLEYIKPMVMSQYAEYLIRTEGEQSIVTWKARGTNGFMGRLASMVMNIDQIVGSMFEKGLAKLKQVVES